jgi:FMN phosphatase YigB (HAD superfamily)
MGFRMTSAILFDLGDTLFRLLPMPDVTDEFAKALASEAAEEASRIIETFRERLTVSRAALKPPLRRPSVHQAQQLRKPRHLTTSAGISDGAPSGRDEVRKRRRRGLKVASFQHLTSPAQMRRQLEVRSPPPCRSSSVEQGVRKPSQRSGQR